LATGTSHRRPGNSRSNVSERGWQAFRGWRGWIVLALVLLLGVFTARYVSLGPGGNHRFDTGSEVRDLPLVSPTLLGWILPGDRARIDSAQVSPDGLWLYLSSIRGEGDQLASITLTRTVPGVVVVDLRLITIPSAGHPAVGFLFGTRVWLDEWWYEGHPPLIIDASTGSSVVITTFIP
jgi:hypothetical protein